MFLKIEASDPWLAAAGQARARSLSETLELARSAAIAAGVTRLADVSGLAPFGIPVFQAVRPHARLLSVSQGKGLTPMAAMVSALLEAVEQHCAERAAPRGRRSSLHALGRDAVKLWAEADRSPGGLRLDPALERDWIPALNLSSGGTTLLPADLVSLDFTRPGLPDICRSTVGLATGNSDDEACVAALGELLEHHLQDAIASWSPRERRSAELDLDSVDDPLPRALIARIRGRGFAVRVWAMGQAAGIAAFRCVITDAEGPGTALPPAGGTACHPDRTTALLRALLEAVQSRVTLVAGARDDLGEAHYRDGGKQTIALILGALSFGPGTLPWSRIPHQSGTDNARHCERLLRAAEGQSALPILIHRHAPPHPGLCVVHAFAPGLTDPARARPKESRADDHPPARPTRVSTKRPVLFVGPSLVPELIPADIDVRPPARGGDLAALIGEQPPAVGLIDGCFETAPTVWHKEMLDLVAHGIPVIGGASLGALRAAELHRFGVTGIGTIFEAYRDGIANRDDAVMVSHAPAELGHRPLTVALVDMEAVLQAADLPFEERRALQRIARRLDFRERTWERCLDLYRARIGRPASMDADQLAGAGSLKQRDALRLVAALRAGLPRPAPFPRPPLTSFYRIILERRAPTLS
jgi:ribosomal protein S12 methylthiotransferase accessory factor